MDEEKKAQQREEGKISSDIRYVTQYVYLSLFFLLLLIHHISSHAIMMILGQVAVEDFVMIRLNTAQYGIINISLINTVHAILLKKKKRKRSNKRSDNY
jgi:hypothetical protein